MLTCPSCGRENAGHFNFCLDCGTELPRPVLAAPVVAPPVVAPAAAAPQQPVAASTPTASSLPSSSQPVYVAPTAPIADIPPPAAFLAPPVAAPMVQEPAAPPVQAQPLYAANVAALDAFAGHGSSPALQAIPAVAPPVHASPNADISGGFGAPLSVAPAFAEPAAAYSAPPPAAPPPPPQVTPLVAPVHPVTAPPRPAFGTPASRPAAAAAPAASLHPTLTCSVCRSQVPVGMKFCGECGARMDPNAPMPNEKSQAAASARQTQFLHVTDIQAQAFRARLVVIDSAGREGMTYNLNSPETLAGRKNGLILLEDPHVSPTHAAFRIRDRALFVSDLNSLNGVYVRLRAEIELKPGDHVRMGRQLLRFEDTQSLPIENMPRLPDDDSRLWGSPDGAMFGRMVQLLEDGRTGDVRVLRGDEVRIGRDVGDIVFSSDGFVSGRHCVLQNRSGRCFLKDVGSSNGTYVRVRADRQLTQDDFILLGNQMMRVDLR